MQKSERDLRNLIRSAIADTFVERNYIISTKNVLMDFLNSIGKISIVGFNTDMGRNYIWQSITTGADGSNLPGRQEMIIDFLITVYTNLRMQSLTAEDLHNVYISSVDDLLNSDTIPSEYRKVLGNIEADILTLTAFILRLNLQYISNLLNKGEI